LEASNIDIKEKVPASRKLRESEARDLAKAASKLIVAKGKKLAEFPAGGGVSDEAISAMLGPTGNLRAPTLRVGKTLLVGFNEEAYQGVFG
jgi:arsenate reductase-like glutaredoxin family protein